MSRFANLEAPFIPPGRLGIGLLIAFGALHIAAVLLLPSSMRAFLSPRFNLLIALALLGMVVVWTMSMKLLATLLVVVPALQVGSISAVGMALNPTPILGAALSIGLAFRLFTQQRRAACRAWTTTGATSLWAVAVATVSVALSAIANGQELSSCTPWFLAAAVALSLIVSSRYGYLTASTIPVALLAGFAITATSDLRQYFRGTAVIQTGLHAGRFVGGLGDYELLAEFYAVAVVIALATLVHTRRLAVTLVALYVIGLGLVLVFLTQSRGPIILLAFACPFLLITALIRRTVSKPRVVIITAVGTILGIALTPAIMASNTFERLLGIVHRGDLEQTINRSSVWPLIVSDPKFQSAGVFGNGPVGIYDWFGIWPHSLFLWTFWSLGILGCIFVVLLAATSIAGIIQWRKYYWVTPTLGFGLILLLADEVKIEFPREGSMVLFVLAICALVGAASISERGNLLGHSEE